MVARPLVAQQLMATQQRLVKAAAAPAMVPGRDVSTKPPVFVGMEETQRAVRPFSYWTLMNVSSAQARGPAPRWVVGTPGVAL
jgi:hypothetical protein